MAGYSHLSWACPYFAWDAKRVIKCEAGRLIFPTYAAEKDFADRYCANVDGWPRCPHAHGWTQYYESQGG